MATEKKTMPKGGRKGGSVFPRLPLAKALEYSAKLVSKTHVGPQPPNAVLVGVFGTAKSDGQIRSSALKQYALLEASDKGMQASNLARRIEAAPDQEKSSLIQKAFLSPKVFHSLFETFHGDTVSRAKIRQQAIGLKVHPDAADDCVEYFVSSVVIAGLGHETGDGVTLASSATLTQSPSLNQLEVDTNAGDLGEDAERNRESAPGDGSTGEDAGMVQNPPAGRAIFHVNVTLDSSLDSDKLEKHLKLLKKYGAI